MKRMVQKSVLATLAIAVLLGFGLVATAATLNVPGQYETIGDALAVAVAGDTIAVAAGYDSEEENEVFPITVTLDNITIVAASGATLRVPASSAGVVFKGVTGGKVEGFRITSETGVDPEDYRHEGMDLELGDIGVLVKESTNVTVEDNTIFNLLAGIRLIGASYNTIVGNTLYDIGAVRKNIPPQIRDDTPIVDVEDERTGIAIFLEISDSNTLGGNEAYNSGMGLFLFESHYNSVFDDSYHDNVLVGVDLNDSSRNGLDGLSVLDNGTWGILLMLSPDNLVENCEVAGNGLGGIELAGSSLNTIRGNYIHDNGNVVGDNFGIVVAKGDKALFTSEIFDSETPLGEIDKIREKKHFVEWQVGMLKDWLYDLDEELIEIEQKILIAIGMCENDEPDSDAIIDKIQEAIDEKHCIANWECPEGCYPDPFIEDLSDSSHRPGFVTLLTDARWNFSLAGAGQFFDRQFDSLYIAFDPEEGPGFIDDADYWDCPLDWRPVTEDYEGQKYPLTKLKILFLIALDLEIYGEDPWEALTDGDFDDFMDLVEDVMSGRETDFPLPEDTESLTKSAIIAVLGWSMWYEVHEIIREVENLETPIAIDEYLKEEILGKLNLILIMLEAAGVGGEEFLDYVGPALVEGTLDFLLEAAITSADAGQLGDCQDALWEAYDLIDLEMIPLKESILDEEIWWIERKLTEINQELPPEVLFNGTIIGKKEKPVGDDCCEGGDRIDEEEIDDVKRMLRRALNWDEIARQVLGAVTGGDDEFETEDIDVENFESVCSTENVIESNVFTTQVITDGYNVAISLECPNNLVVNNLITNEDIINGHAGFFGTMDRGILMLSSHNTIVYNAIEYVDIGIVRGGCWEREDIQLHFKFQKLAKAQVDANGRPLSIVAVMEVLPGNVWVVRDEVEVKWNRIALNLIERTGYGIQILLAESNQIDENMFIENTDGGIWFGHDVGPHIIMIHNDFVGGVSVANTSATTRDASDNYAFESPTSGLVVDPDAEAPFCTANFGRIDKFETLGIERFFNEDYPTLPPMAQSSNLRRLVVAGVTFTLPDEKPRTCADVFGGTPPPLPGQTCCDLEPGEWNLISLSVDPDNADPEAVFDEVGGTLFLFYLNADTGTWDTVANGELTEVGPMGGYWLWNEDLTEYCVDGTELTGDQTIQLGEAGWQMIGVPYDVAWGPAAGATVTVTRGTETLPLANAVAAGWIFNTIWERDAAAGVWIKPTINTGATLVPCAGYFIFTYFDDLTLNLTQNGGGPPGPPPQPTSLPKGLEVKSDPPIPPTPIVQVDSALEFGNYPNPITDVHTTTFRVMSALPVETIRVMVFDMAGRLVYEDEGPGDELVWHTENELGEYLANGVYLYRLFVLIDGEWIESEVKKLAIYR